ncbi:MAG: TIGR04376 family protein [Leptolyngbyaceae cyanobacterium bins.349]|nr:TIGR04376 family protein [Leptolyngbyaceae cyanobacterium bins.349]
MGLFDDFSKFLEDRLDEYLAANPQLELMAMEEKLREQEEETLRLMTELKMQERQLQDEILAIAQDIQVWHARVEKAQAKGRLDLAQPAQEYEASLLRQGNQKWGQMEMLKDRIQQTQELQQKIQQRRKEVQVQVTQAQAARTTTQPQTPHIGWSEPASSPNSASTAQLEKQFQRWEAEEELEQLKRNMGK